MTTKRYLGYEGAEIEQKFEVVKAELLILQQLIEARFPPHERQRLNIGDAWGGRSAEDSLLLSTNGNRSVGPELSLLLENDGCRYLFDGGHRNEIWARRRRDITNLERRIAVVTYKYVGDPAKFAIFFAALCAKRNGDQTPDKLGESLRRMLLGQKKVEEIVNSPLIQSGYLAGKMDRSEDWVFAVNLLMALVNRGHIKRMSKPALVGFAEGFVGEQVGGTLQPIIDTRKLLSLLRLLYRVLNANPTLRGKNAGGKKTMLGRFGLVALVLAWFNIFSDGRRIHPLVSKEKFLTEVVENIITKIDEEMVNWQGTLRNGGDRLNMTDAKYMNEYVERIENVIRNYPGPQ